MALLSCRPVCLGSALGPDRDRYILICAGRCQPGVIGALSLMAASRPFYGNLTLFGVDFKEAR
jgi:hypothetical protein